jgi:hypothetical protein
LDFEYEGGTPRALHVEVRSGWVAVAHPRLHVSTWRELGGSAAPCFVSHARYTRRERRIRLRYRQRRLRGPVHPVLRTLCCAGARAAGSRCSRPGGGRRAGPAPGGWGRAPPNLAAGSDHPDRKLSRGGGGAQDGRCAAGCEAAARPNLWEGTPQHRCCSRVSGLHARSPDPPLLALASQQHAASLTTDRRRWAQVLEQGTRQMVAVRLTKGGRELGALELCVQHQAMPDRQ